MGLPASGGPSGALGPASEGPTPREADGEPYRSEAAGDTRCRLSNKVREKKKKNAGFKRLYSRENSLPKKLLAAPGEGKVLI